MNEITQKDREILRRLAGRLCEIANSAENERKKARILRHNRLDSDGGPIILCSPEGAWREVNLEAALECESGLARGVELNLRARLYTAEVLQDDSFIEPVCDIGWQIAWGDYGVRVMEMHPDEQFGSFHYQPELTDLSDESLARLHFRSLSVDRDATMRYLAMLQEAIGDLLDVRIHGGFWWTLGLTWEVIKLIGLDNLMLYMYDDPDGLHKLMGWMRDEHTHMMDFFENEGLLSLNNGAEHVASGGIGYTDELGCPPPERVTYRDLWGFAESQETVGISPEMFAEFILPYQLPLLERFGLNCYGCCEPVDTRWAYIKQIPRLRRISISPWCDQEMMAAELGNRYIFSRKPNPSLVSVGFYEDEIRKELSHTLRVCRQNNCNLEMILKDTHTVENHPERLARWVEIAREEAAKI